MTYYKTTKLYRIYWPCYPSKCLYVKMHGIFMVKRTGHVMHDKILPLLGRHLASRTIKQLNEQITKAVLNIDRCYNM